MTRYSKTDAKKTELTNLLLTFLGHPKVSSVSPLAKTQLDKSISKFNLFKSSGEKIQTFLDEVSENIKIKKPR